MPLSPEELDAWRSAVVTVDGVPHAIGAGPGCDEERWVVLAAQGWADLEQRLRQAKRRHRRVALRLAGEDREAALVEELTRERAVKLAYKLRLPAVLRLGPRGLELVYTGR